jgi:hypothetical protein
MHKIIISKTAKKVISNSQLKTENSAVKMIPAFEQNIRPLETAKQVRKTSGSRILQSINR